MTYMFILKCALKLVEEIILYYDARSKKHQSSGSCYCSCNRYAIYSYKHGRPMSGVHSRKSQAIFRIGLLIVAQKQRFGLHSVGGRSYEYISMTY